MISNLSFFLGLILLISSSNAQTVWANVTGLGGPARVSAIISNGTDLYAAGAFASYGNVARYNTITNTWTDITPATPASIRALAIRGDDLFLGGGEFYTNIYFGRINANSYGTQYYSGLNNTVYALAVFNGDVLVGSIMTRIYKFFNNSFVEFDSTPFSGTVRRLIIVNGILHAVGQFTVPCSRWTRWNGTTWDCPNSQVIPNFVYGIGGKADGSEFHLGGIFSSPAWYIMKATAIGSSGSYAYSNASTDIVGSTVNSIVYDGDDVYLGGSFTSLGNRVLKLNNGIYSNLSTGILANLGLEVSVLHIHGGYLYAGGDFTHGIRRYQIAPTPPTPPPTPPTPKPTPAPTPSQSPTPPTPQPTPTPPTPQPTPAQPTPPTPPTPQPTPAPPTTPVPTTGGAATLTIGFLMVLLFTILAIQF